MGAGSPRSSSTSCARTGYGRVAYLGPPAAMRNGVVHGAGHERLEGFRAVARSVGLPLTGPWARTGDLAEAADLARELAGDLVRMEGPPTTVVAGADTLAVALLRALREVGLRVPEDVAVASFDEPAHADLIDPPVTALDRHDHELGRRAAEMLRGEGAGGRSLVRVPLALHARRSCGCAAPGRRPGAQDGML